MAALLLITAATVSGVYYYQHRFVRNNQDLFTLLPPGDGTIFFADVSLLQKAGMLKRLAMAKSRYDADYEGFVRQTGFDYAEDLKTVAGKAVGPEFYFLLRGRFHWEQLHRYAAAQGGNCTDGFCTVPGTTTGRRVSFKEIQPDVLALAAGPELNGAKLLKSGQQGLQGALPEQPVWVSLSEKLLKNPVDLPLPVRIFAVTLQSSHPAIFSLDAAVEGTGAAFKLQLDAFCENVAAAETVRSQLEIQTKMLKLQLVKEHREANPADLTGLLTAGNFQVIDRHLTGVWPVRNELLQAIQ